MDTIEPQGFIVLRHIVENYKILKAVAITPDGTFNLIEGQNGQGKTSLLETIKIAVRGGAAIPDMPITKGETKCVIETDFGRAGKVEVTIRRTITKKGETISITTPAGPVTSTPQKFINDLFGMGDLSFDPLAFMRMKESEQFQKLMEALGFDPTAIDNDKKKITNERLLVGREVKRIEGAIKSTERPTVKATDETIDLTAIREKGRALLAQHEALVDLRTKYHECDAVVGARQDDIDRINGEIEAMKVKLQSARDAREQAVAARTKLSQQLENTDLPPLDSLQSELEAAQQHNAAVVAAQKYEEMRTELRAAEKQYNDFTAQLEKLDAQKAAAIKKANLPIEGLTFAENELFLNEVPLKQCSASEQLKISFEIAAALTKGAKMVLIEDGSLLDDNGKAYIQKRSGELGLQVYMEAVGNGGTIGFHVSGGEVRTADTKQEGLF